MKKIAREIINKIKYKISMQLIKFPAWLLSLEYRPGLAKDVIASTRLLALRSSLKSCGERLWVQFPVTIDTPEAVEIGDDVSITAYVHIWGGGGVMIGNRTMIGTHTSITSVTHDYKQSNMYQTLIKEAVVIEEDVWIGSNCVIMPGVHIQRGAVIGAGSVVTKNVDKDMIVAGVPAQPIKKRLIQTSK